MQTHSVDAVNFRLFFEKAGHEIIPPVTRDDLEKTASIEDDQGLVITYQGRPAGFTTNLKVTFLEHPAGKEKIARLEVEAVEGCSLVRVQFPYITYTGIEPFDQLLVGAPWGDCVANPVYAIKEFCALRKGLPEDEGKLEFIRAGVDEVTYQYPGILAMQYAVLYNASTSRYLACYSTGTDSRAFSAAASGPDRLTLSFDHYPFLTNAKWGSPPCSTASLAGGWHAAADLYAENVKPVYQSPDVPGWLRSDFHGWVEIMMLDERMEPFCRFRDLPFIFHKIKAAGMTVLHVAGWNNPYFDARYPDFDINPSLGTADELREAIVAIRAEGGRVILYINGRLVDPASRFYAEGGAHSVCRNPQGEPYLERYGNDVVFNVACPSSELYANQIKNVIARLIIDYGAHGVQIDQVSCTQGFFCYRQDHGHPTPATNFLPGLENLLRQVRAIHQSLDPEFFSWIEGCSERFGQFYDVEQGHGEEGSNWNIGALLPEMFRFTFPRRIVTGLSNSLQKLCHTFVQGKPFDFNIQNLDNLEFCALLGDFLALRCRYPEYFLHGIFRDCAGINIAGGARAFRLEREDGNGTLINLWQPGAGSGSDCQAWVSNPRPGWKKYALYPSNLGIEEDGSHFVLSWRGPVATMLFEGEAA